MDGFMRKIRVGDLCSVQQPFKLHYGVCVGRNSRGELVFVHNTPDGGVTYATESAFARGRPITAAAPSLPREEVVRRARALVGQRYDLLAFNCEHAANFAASGKAESLQAQRGVALAGIAAVLTLWPRKRTRVDCYGYRRDRRGRFAS
jgi:hypothetical protein